MKNIQLRRGNNVYHNEELKTIDCIAPGHVIFLEDRKGNDDFGQWVDLDEVEFIPLNEERLLKFGFVKKEIGYSKLTEMEQCFLISFGKHTSVNGIKFNNEIKYVHQLQNLIFAILQEEIKLND